MTDVASALADVERLVAELHRASGELADLATAGGDEDLAAAAVALQAKLVEAPAKTEPADNPFMASHRAFLERIRVRRLSRAGSLP